MSEYSDENLPSDVTPPPDAATDPVIAERIRRSWDRHKDYSSQETETGLVIISKVPDYIEDLNAGKGPYL